MSMGTDYYSSHEAVHRSRRTQGAPGWFTPDHEFGRELEAAVAATLSSGQVPRRGKSLELGRVAGNLPVWLYSKVM